MFRYQEMKEEDFYRLPLYIPERLLDKYKDSELIELNKKGKSIIILDVNKNKISYLDYIKNKKTFLLDEEQIKHYSLKQLHLYTDLYKSVIIQTASETSLLFADYKIKELNRLIDLVYDQERIIAKYNLHTLNSIEKILSLDSSLNNWSKGIFFITNKYNEIYDFKCISHSTYSVIDSLLDDWIKKEKRSLLKEQNVYIHFLPYFSTTLGKKEIKSYFIKFKEFIKFRKVDEVSPTLDTSVYPNNKNI